MKTHQAFTQWALYGKQHETCRFLVYAGADPDYKYVLLLSGSNFPFVLNFPSADLYLKMTIILKIRLVTFYFKVHCLKKQRSY